jgi:predicted ATPase
LFLAAVLYQLCRDTQKTHEQIEALIALGTEHGFPSYLALSSGLRGWVLTRQGEEEAGIVQMRQGLATYQASGAKLFCPYWLALLATAYGNRGQTEEGLNIVDEALAVVNTSEERFYEAELWRLKGELTLQKGGRVPVRCG